MGWLFSHGIETKSNIKFVTYSVALSRAPVFAAWFGGCIRVPHHRISCGDLKWRWWAPFVVLVVSTKLIYHTTLHKIYFTDELHSILLFFSCQLLRNKEFPTFSNIYVEWRGKCYMWEYANFLPDFTWLDIFRNNEDDDDAETWCGNINGKNNNTDTNDNVNSISNNDKGDDNDMIWCDMIRYAMPLW